MLIINTNVEMLVLMLRSCLLAWVQGNETKIIISRYEDHFLVSAAGVVFMFLWW